MSLTTFQLSCRITQFKFIFIGTNYLQCYTPKIKSQSPGRFCHKNYLFMFNHFLLFNRQKLNNNGVVIHLSVKMSMASCSTMQYKTITSLETSKFYNLGIFVNIIDFDVICISKLYANFELKYIYHSYVLFTDTN